MSIFQRFSTVIKAGRELGFERLWRYAIYRIQIGAGYFALRDKDGRSFTEFPDVAFSLHPVMRLPDPGALKGLLGAGGERALMTEADEIVSGQVRLFGGDPVRLNLGPASSQIHWSTLERGSNSPQEDIKFIWEPARFGWAFTLGRAYRVTGDERYPVAFWRYLEEFNQANPPYYGQHWRSAQEVALRLLALVFASEVFNRAQSSTPERMAVLGRAIVVHTGRIPPSLSYARAQNNNHLLVEAVGLYTAASALQNHPAAGGWRELGWHWANRALQSQINADGVYMQHSTNYQRLMLHAALWLNCLVRYQGQTLPTPSLERLQAATRWLLALLDAESGQTPNLGPNDGANILPLSGGDFRDYRPVLQAASGGFLGERAFPVGDWDEIALWLGVDLPDAKPVERQPVRDSEDPLVLRSKESWAYLRAARFAQRPGHADQLHFDLWWRGLNIAQDAGTYLYNAAPPWDNALSRSLVHNTVTVNERDQMSWAGRFLWLDWAQASQIEREKAENGSWERTSAIHDGYRRLGVLHRRSVTLTYPDGWHVTDELFESDRTKSAAGETLRYRLHWLLPDWYWNLEQINQGAKLSLESPKGIIFLEVKAEPGEYSPPGSFIQLARAGEVLHGQGPVSPILGWASPTYGVKEPALSFSLSLSAPLPLKFTSQWTLPQP